ncbi:MAG: hypothetical protein A3C85_02560 [Candidatus Doudnabacteria bacterium RIFCSPHIGHO2_02_FULL_48_21]|uniref:BrnT family toxin n=1 Tax=Candidatus Doudnabacteria bacterium RIFCSPLOWO2_02_FULL_48_13 TaxID=1817845 RepID=A0A1F5QD59_9BACT|nr:MAG: hypothetical protein A3K05_00040 [Candidatus Doudnabacteria bacterium RIFCSPHIGHO2_01_48_18]OGE78786.1 MAG: hypothetical protein A2668_01425 [Candidatus Doudnabacteria bacterium RIFCSPHIGHO2_01_FULL_48_180]OGE91827.1 MAG: hypothetical protein A3F44_00525 [Candidatus Doudnabacteria bacterium RIFCSPHIGHO2_12_FULL_47_25]OGE93707.1 MAG: hypothetical protein A3C85_02560 [Candidatus Doudnabacteria bacterium RIFCSPHIGHO2_02_FULL_48_21]OGE97895.1 MAG: hypothetical protein A3A83_00335 [Candidatu
MRILPKPVQFEWDAGNKAKSLKKHGIFPQESEQVFRSDDFILLGDKRHSLTEERQLIIGTTDLGRLLSMVFTIRDRRVRIISARPSSKKERKIYEETAKSS